MKIYRNRLVIIIADILLLCSSFYFSHLIRFEFLIPQDAFDKFVWLLGVVLSIKVICFFFFDLYRGMWRYSSLNDFINIGKASTLGTIFLVVLLLYTNRFAGVSRAVFIIDWVLTLFLIAGSRIVVRLYFEQLGDGKGLQNLIKVAVNFFKGKNKQGIGTIIIGAGDCGQKICREINDNFSVHYNVFGFMDDDPKKIGRKIHGISVLNNIESMEAVVSYTGAEEVIIAIPSLEAERMRAIVELCKDCGVRYKTVPSMAELINGKISVTSIRNVEYRDLLGRKPVHLNKESIGNYLGNKTIIITGAGGSIGKGLCRQVCQYSPDKIILFERAESPLYDIDLELKKKFEQIDVIPILGDIQNKIELEKVFKEYQPEIVFHAAAYKHVPMLEKHPWKAVENNIFGTQNVIKTAKEFDCDKFVLVSTDKAVNPTNIMGTSKRITEMMVQNLGADSDSKTSFITVRFGNVIGSSGSVIPLFKRQIELGGPVTVTHPDVIRYFMLIPEACQLILQAGAMGNGGEIFILEMGSPIKIDSMARDLIRLSGLEPEKDIKIEYIGLRPGEKLYEELITQGEGIVPTEHKKIMVLAGHICEQDQLNGQIDRIIEVAKAHDGEKIKTLLKEMVPEYVPNGGDV